MKVFDPDTFLNVAIDAVQAREISTIADHEIRKASFVLYGIYENGEYRFFSSKQKPGDTHAILGMIPKKLKAHST